VVPTFEPKYKKNEALEDFYQKNFDSWLNPLGNFEVTLILSDFKSSEDFKVFLRRYVQSSSGNVVLIDGKETTGVGIAVNIGFRLTPSGIGIFAASDTRARDRFWLNHLVDDFNDPKVMASFSTSPVDGSHLVDQLQSIPLDKPSRPVIFPEGPIINVVAFRRDLLSVFSDRVSDVSPTNLIEGIMWQIEAVEGVAKINYRCNVLHDHFITGGRYDRTDSDNWIVEKRSIEEALFRGIRQFLSIPHPHFDPAPFRPILNPLKQGFLQEGLRGFFRALYNRLRKTQISYIKKEVRKKGLWFYLNQKRFFSAQHKALMFLPCSARIGIVQSLFFVEQKLYDHLRYELYDRNPLPKNKVKKYVSSS